MNLEESLRNRSDNKCELCSSADDLSIYVVPPESNPNVDNSILVCATCKKDIEEPSRMNPNHWRCLNDSMWSQVPAVQVMAWRVLNNLKSEGWPQDLLDMMYLEDDTKKWAIAGANISNEEPTLDVNGTTLNNGDSVTLVKDLVIQGANFTAKRGTLVKGISLTDNIKQIEGRINGTRIVLRAAYMKKV